MLGMEVNREFYTAPQRFILNAKPEDFGVTEGMSKAEKFRAACRGYGHDQHHSATARTTPRAIRRQWLR
jgi:hypothetical protein